MCLYRKINSLNVKRSRLLRRIAAIALALAILPGTVLRDQGSPWDNSRRMTVERLAVPTEAPRELGPFRLRGVWNLASRDGLFGGYSALVALPGARLLAIGDRGGKLEFAEPPGSLAPYRMEHSIRDPAEWSAIADAEAATTGPDGEFWIAWEDRKAISRFSRDWSDETRVFPNALRHWSKQFGPEAMARMPDGRFLIVSEAFAPDSSEVEHETLLFASDPTVGGKEHRRGTVEPSHGVLSLPEGYRPTDMALLPDGRVLILLRQVVWPLPMRFSSRIALADPEELYRTGHWTGREIARLDSPVPGDNYEGLAIRPRTDGKLDVWVISDDNRSATQRTLLLKLELDPQDLPPR